MKKLTAFEAARIVGEPARRVKSRIKTSPLVASPPVSRSQPVQISMVVRPQ